MASVAFSTLGQALGGPLGAAVGAAVGGTVDGAIFGRRGAGGGTDLLVQRSAYGEALPRLFGRSRVGGIVIWALPSVEAGAKGSGRRGMATSLAIALSSGPIRRVGRIWADGREIRDSGGRFETPTKMRLYCGRGIQKPDPLVVAVEGLDRAPGYQQLAYVVFEDLALGAFGNRIPSLSFEVDADGEVPGSWLGSLLDEAGLEGVAPSATGAVGYGAAAPRLADDVEMLARVADARIAYPDGVLRLAQSGRHHVIPRGDHGAADSRGGGPSTRSSASGLRPGSASIDYYDPDRDYQAGRQTVANGRSGVGVQAAAPLIATATQARDMAGRLLRSAESAVETLELTLGWKWLAVSVGDVLQMAGRPEHWRVARRDVRGLMVRLQATLLPEENGPAAAGDPGRNLPAPVLPSMPTRLMAFETPVPLRTGPASVVWLSANGDPGWRQAFVSALDAGTEIAIGEIAGPSAAGVLTAPLAAGVEGLWDEDNVIRVALPEGGVAFESRSASAVLSGANLVRIGRELIQFRCAEPMPGNEMHLSGLLRGCFGTGFGGRTHDVGARAELIRPDRLLGYPISPDMIGGKLIFLAEGRGDPPGGVDLEILVDGAAFGVMAPCHVRIARRGDGALQTQWVSRDARSYDWGAGEPNDAGFRWKFRGSGGFTMERIVFSHGFELPATEQISAYGSLLSAGTIVVEAMGDGPPALRTSVAIEI